MFILQLAATDDTLTLAKDENDMRTVLFDVATFEESYGMRTNWDKSRVFRLGKNQTAGEITLKLADGSMRTMSITTDRSFLKTPINDPVKQADIITGIIDGFSFPKLDRTFPLPALVNIANMTLAARIRSRLQFHSIRESAARGMSAMINVKFKRYYGMAFAGSVGLLTSTARQGGLGFPNIPKMNAIAGISGIHRSMNSSNVTFNLAFQIMHATHQCHSTFSHRCYLPYAPVSEYIKSLSPNNRPRQNNWKAMEPVRRYMSELGLHLIPTSDLIDDCNPQHAAIANHGSKTEGMFFEGDRPVLSIPPVRPITGKIVWATDGSADKADTLEKRRCGFAVIGPEHNNGRITFSGRLHDLATIQDAELTAICYAIHMDDLVRWQLRGNAPAESVIYTDHLNTVRRIQAINPNVETSVQSHEASRHVLRWLEHIIKERPHISVVHQKAHTSDNSVAASLNRKADKLARDARQNGQFVKFPIPYVDVWALWTPDFDVSTQRVTSFISDLWDRVKYKLGPDDNVRKYYKPDSSGWSRRIVYLTRSRQLPTSHRVFVRKLDIKSLTCPLCDVDPRTIKERHVFVECRGVQNLLREGRDEAMKIATDLSAEEHRRELRHLASIIFEDDDMWVTGQTTFWKGELPRHFDYSAYEPKYTKLFDELAFIATTKAGQIWGRHAKAYDEGELVSNIELDQAHGPFNDAPDTDDLAEVRAEREELDQLRLLQREEAAQDNAR